MRIGDILRRKGREVVTVVSSDTVAHAIAVLVEHSIGGVVVVDDAQVTGILTERDILRLAASVPEQLGTLLVGEVMTRDVITAQPQDAMRGVMEVMTENRIRHLPVLDAGGLVGIVSIGDIVNACMSVAEDENVHLKHYIQGAES